MTLHARDIEVLKTSDLLDANWYVAQYPDVGVLGIDPADHYLRFGARLLRDPGPKFSTRQYLEANPDVCAAGVNALLHYLQHGRSESRSLVPPTVSQSDFAEPVDVVVPVFNALDDVKKCLESVGSRKDGLPVRCIVVNDGSDEQTSEWLRRYCDDHQATFELIEHSGNRGYTCAVNTGIRASTARYVVMLNSDTIVTRGWLRGLVRCMHADPATGIVGPMSNAASWQNVPALRDDKGAFAVNELPSNMTPDDMAALVASVSRRRYPRLPFVNGFCFMVRREVIETVGLMDEEGFPVGYGEENDYCVRAAAAGYTLAVADDAYVFHAKSKSFGHHRRIELSRQGSEILRRKHSPERIDELLHKVANVSDLAAIRASVTAAIAARSTGVVPYDPLSIRVLFLLPVHGGGGGAHSVVQEVAEMRRLGGDAVVAVRAEHLEHYLDTYRDVDQAERMFVGFTDASLPAIAGGYDVAVGTIFASMSTVGELCEAHPHLLPAYYVQDYEPLFFSADTPNWQIAKDSYTRVPNAVLFAKTRWIANRVKAQHGIDVHLVTPSVDHAVYRPTRKERHAKIQICAMVRPQTPRRGAQRTMRVLKEVARTHRERVSIRLFGCESDSPLFLALDRDFEFRNLGVLKRPEVADLLRESDVFLDLSDYQAFGRTALEAMACGCTAVVPAAGGADEYAVDGVNCVVVDSFDEAECVSRLGALISDQGMLRRLQLSALETAAHYSVRRAAISELALFSRELARFRRTSSEAATAAVDRVRTGDLAAAGDPGIRMSPTAKPAQLAPPAPRKLPLTALVIAWDVGHNPLGRSYMLAEVVDRVVRNVVIAGFQFPRYGSDVWEPLRDSRIPVITFPGSNLPEFLASLESIAARIRPDIVIACKPRLPSLQLGAAIKDRWGCPLIVDIDDHELSFFKGAEPLPLASLATTDPSRVAGKEEPYSEIWTRLSEKLISFADERIVSNIALQRRFGGTIVPHVRDEIAFDPSKFSKTATRTRFGVPGDAHVVLFFGTPRLHKGVGALAEAVGRSTDTKLRLVIVGTAPDRSVTSRIDALAKDRAICIPNQPFETIPEVLAMADVVCLPQEEDNPISHYQLPAKAIDAVAMGIPLLVSRTAPLMQLVEDGVAQLVDARRLTAALEATVSARPVASTGELRSRFLARYSYDAAAKQMSEIIQRAIRNVDRRSVAPLAELVHQQRRLLGIGPAGLPKRSGGHDHVLFWKQNDTTLYGRRHDMVIKYLASRDDVRRVIVFDAPISEFDLLKRRHHHGGPSQDRWIYVRTYEKLLGKHDTEKISYNVFVYPPGKYRTRDDDLTKAPLLDGYIEYLKHVFQREGVQPDSAVFWMYPKNYLAPAIIDHFKPKQVVVDVVDDHRAWPGVSDVERARLSHHYRDTLARADIGFVNCEPMQQSMKEFLPDIRLVPNGCDLDPPRREPKRSALFDAFKAWSGQTIGFIGNLEAKIDIPLIAKISERFLDCQIVLLGSTHANPAVRQLEQCTNIRMPGVVPYEEIAAWMSRFDVGIVPHIDMPMTQNMNPLKLYVYLSAGIPVVSTEVFNIARDTELVRVARTHDEFLDQISRTLAQGRPAREQAASYAMSNSWANRFAEHIDRLHASTAR